MSFESCSSTFGSPTPQHAREIFVGLGFIARCEGETPALRGFLEYRVPTGDVTPPGTVKNISVARVAGSATVSWTNPGDADLAFILVEYLKSTTAPGSPKSGFLAYAGTGTSVVITKVASTAKFAVAIYAVDSSGNVGFVATG